MFTIAVDFTTNYEECGHRPTSPWHGGSDHVRPDVISFSTSMDGAPWRKSLVLLQQMQAWMAWMGHCKIVSELLGIS